MPIAFRVDHERRVVVAVAHGVLTLQEMFQYQRDLAAQPGIEGYYELVDMTPVTDVGASPATQFRGLAGFAATTDQPGRRSRFAIVAPTDLLFGLGRMYQAYRASEPGSTKEVGVFRTQEEACAFLDIRGPLAMPDWSGGTPA